MGEPVRIQLSRAKGWRMPENTLKVDRTTPWGNRYVVWCDDGQWLVTLVSCHWPVPSKAAGIALAVEKHASDLRASLAKEIYPPSVVLHELRGKNLACWCKLPAPGEPDLCHAAVLLELANKPA